MIPFVPLRANGSPGWLEARILLLGCGNVLFGDDGFGPAVVEHLNRRCVLPPWVRAEDVGTGVRDLLFDLLLSERRPQRIFVVDAVHGSGRNPGELLEVPMDAVSPEKSNDFSVHHFPSLNLLRELAEVDGLELCILGAQVKEIPSVVRPGLSPEVAAAVPRAVDWLLERIRWG
ncbi:MAG: hydrogenase maturation protease [Deltaproteobacteria bacterium]|nr:hydrogenase maturation protease [Deltaproteobacteria bacterium]